MTYKEVMKQLEELGTEQTRKTYLSHGAQEPLFGVTIKDMNPIAKKIKTNQALAEELYASGNYDAMYFAGIISDPKAMTEEDFERWISKAYNHMIGDYTVSIVLADSPLAFTIADKWITSGEEIKMSAGWCAYTWLLGIRKNEEFDIDKLSSMLTTVRDSIHSAPNRTRYAMNSFIAAVGISYPPLHKEAMAVANVVGKVEVNMGKTSSKVPLATDTIKKAAERGRIGFKRKATRC